MKFIDYQKLYSCVEKHNLVELSEDHDWLSYNTLVSIYASKIKKQAIVRRVNPKQEKFKYYERYNHGESLMAISKMLAYPPCLLAKLILECQYGESKANKAMISQFRKHPDMIPDERLAKEISICNAEDMVYSPFMDRIREATGLEYEYILQESLRNLGIPFVEETDLRREGQPVTPDCKLLIPIEVDGLVVNWIESKACFGDEYTIRRNMEEQLTKYVNRFGSGLVIYWFGFIEDLKSPKISELKRFGVLVMDSFPHSISMLHTTSSVLSPE